MKALTIWQPGATLIMIGAKPWEWRAWPAPKAFVGQRIVIHAGARAPKRDEIHEILLQLGSGDSSLIEAPARELLERAHVGSYPLACGLGTAVLGTPMTASLWVQLHDRHHHDSDRIDHSKWAWPLSDIQAFKPVVPARGAQGFWAWPRGDSDHD